MDLLLYHLLLFFWLVVYAALFGVTVLVLAVIGYNLWNLWADWQYWRSLRVLCNLPAHGTPEDARLTVAFKAARPYAPKISNEEFKQWLFVFAKAYQEYKPEK